MLIRSAILLFLLATVSFSQETKESFDDLVLHAQTAFRKGDFKESLSMYQKALSEPGTEEEKLVVVRKNAALAALSAGENEIASSLYRQIPGPEGSYGLGISLFRLAEEPDSEPATNAVLRARSANKHAKLFGDAANSFRAAIHDGMSSLVVQTNLVAALDRAKEFLQTAKEADLEVQYGEKNPGELVGLLMDAQEKSYATGIDGVTNTVSSKIKYFEKAAKQQQTVADIWSFLEKSIVSQLKNQTTNEQEIAKLEKAFLVAKDHAEGAKTALEDLKTDAFVAMRNNNLEALEALFMVSDPLQQISKTISVESNALCRVVDRHRFREPAEEQGIVNGLFSIFQQKLPPWLEQMNQQNGSSPEGQPSGNVLSEEDLQELDRLIQQVNGSLESIEKELSPKDQILPDTLIPASENVLNDLIEIKKILEKTQPPRQNEANNQNQQQNQQQDQQQNQQRDPNESQQNENNPSNEQEQQQSSESQPTEESKDESEQKEAESAKDPEEQAAQEMMQAILKLEKQREEEKKKRQFVLPVKVGEKDW